MMQKVPRVQRSRRNIDSRGKFRALEKDGNTFEFPARSGWSDLRRLIEAARDVTEDDP